jgi:hypothetical protein
VGFFLFGKLGSREPQETIRKKSHVFLLSKSQRKKLSKSPLGTWAKKEKNYLIKIRSCARHELG